MKRVNGYNEFLLEKEFQKIVYEIFKLVENDTLNVGDTITWDINTTKKIDTIKDEQPIEFEWTFDQKSKYQKFKDKVSDLKSKLKTAKSWLQEQDSDIDIKFEHPLVNMTKDFLSKLKDKEAVKKYFLKLLDEVKSLPNPVKKKLLIKLSFIFLGYVSVADLTTPEIIEKEPVMAEVKLDLQKGKEEVKSNVEKEVNNDFKGAKFEVAQEGVHKAEGKYTADRDDSGNWTGGEVGEGILLGTKFGIAAPTLVDYYHKSNLGTPSQQDMIDLTYNTALQIYKKDYWDAQKLYNFKSQSIANILYDGCVNQGSGATLNILTKSLEDVGVDSTNVNNWNEFHDELIDDVNNLPKIKIKKLFNTIWNKRWDRYKKIIKDNPRKEKYRDGWKNRLDDLTFNDEIKKDIDIS